eukprot:200908_1
MSSWIILISLIRMLYSVQSTPKPWYCRIIPSCCVRMQSHEHDDVIDVRRESRDASSSGGSVSRPLSLSLSHSQNPLIGFSRKMTRHTSATTYLESTVMHLVDSHHVSCELRAFVETQTDANFDHKWTYVDIFSRTILAMSSFQERKESLAHFQYGQTTSFKDVLQQNATLLVLDGRHTIFDNIPFSEQMVQTLIKNNVPFIASQNYYHTINVIRPHF